MQICQNSLCQTPAILSLTEQLTSVSGEAVDIIQLDFVRFLMWPHTTFLKVKQGKCKLNYSKVDMEAMTKSISRNNYLWYIVKMERYVKWVLVICLIM